MKQPITNLVRLTSFTLVLAALLSSGCEPSTPTSTTKNVKKETGNKEKQKPEQPPETQSKKDGASIFYLEIVTPDVDEAIALHSKMYGVTFGEAIPSFGGARTADLRDGGMIGIRGPLRESEKPVVRPYFLVDDIKKAVESAKENGAVIAMPPMAIKGYGQFAIVIQGGIESGLWQNESE